MSWNQYLAIVGEVVESADPDPRAACPNDGEPLKTAPDGYLFCPYDGWKE
jgi:hypothetical protein